MEKGYRSKLLSVIRYGLMAALFFVAILPLYFYSYFSFWAQYPIIAVFFWSLVTPGWMPYISIFLIGIVCDALIGVPIGLSSALLCLMACWVRMQQRYLAIQPFAIVWLMFATALIGVNIAKWLVVSLYYRTWLPVGELWTEVLLTIVGFPLFYSLLAAFYQVVARWYERMEYDITPAT